MPRGGAVSILSCALCALVACLGSGERAIDPFSREWSPPQVVETGRVRLEPLSPEHAELDHAALTRNRDHLRRTLAWGDWPSADLSIEENRRDLTRHWLEFVGRTAYAYAVLAPDRSRVLGCVYLSPPDPESEVEGARFFYWVAESELAHDLDRHVVRVVLEGFAGAEGPFERLVLPVLSTDARGLAIARELGLEPVGERGDRVLFLHRRGGGGA